MRSWLSFWRVPKSRSNSEKFDELNKALDLQNVPVHIAVIMDGNGRWATRRGLPRAMGHRAGVESLRETVKFCSSLGVKYLTVYAFSTENWKRPAEEVSILMDLLVEYLKKELADLHQNNVRVMAIGRLEELPNKAREALSEARGYTTGNTGLTLNLALNYGGRNEIVEAVRKIGVDVKSGRVNPDNINEEVISDYLFTSGIPDPDLLIRPSGEQRISNFLLWQSAYSEFWYSPVLWPDFRKIHLLEAIVDYQRRQRRFGGLNSI